MNAPLSPAILRQADPPAAAPPAGDDSQVHLWHGRFGPMWIEVRGDAVFVNGQAVEPHPRVASAAGPA